MKSLNAATNSGSSRSWPEPVRATAAEEPTCPVASRPVLLRLAPSALVAGFAGIVKICCRGSYRSNGDGISTHPEKISLGALTVLSARSGTDASRANPVDGLSE